MAQTVQLVVIRLARADGLRLGTGKGSKNGAVPASGFAGTARDARKAGECGSAAGRPLVSREGNRPAVLTIAQLVPTRSY